MRRYKGQGGRGIISWFSFSRASGLQTIGIFSRRRAGSAARRRWELPFLYRLEGRLLKGSADLVFEEGGALVVMDFKTDSILKKAAKERALSHAPQVAAYTMGVEATSGRRVDEIVVSFLRLGGKISLPFDDSAKEKSRGVVRRAG